MHYRMELQRAKHAQAEPEFRRSLEETIRSRPDQLSEMLEDQPLTARLDENLARIRHLFGDDKAPDLVVRDIPVFGETRAAVVYFSNMSDAKQVAESVLRPLLATNAAQGEAPPGSAVQIRAQIQGMLVDYGNLSETAGLADLVHELVTGKAVLLIDGDPHATLFDVAGFEKRAISMPETEVVIRGPREGFVEDLSINLSLIRRRLASPLLRVEASKLGRFSRTKVALLYIDGLATSELVAEVRRRLGGIKLDAILESQYVEELIEDQTFTIFPQVYSTERPDVSAAQLLEGRVVLLVDGTPFALVAPATINMFMQSPSDYYQRWDYSSLTRFIRWLMTFAVVYFTAVYVAVTSFSQFMLPTGLLISFAAAREKVPFTVLTEALVLESVFEVLREAGIRLPKQIGQTISIVGVLVIGQSAVQASIISAPMVIIVAFTGIASFVIPHYNFGISLRILRFPMIILGGVFGLFGIVMGTLIVLFHLVSLRSFGVPYLAPLTPPTRTTIQDSLIRLPRWMLLRRPRMLRTATTWRMTRGQQPRRGMEHGQDNEVRSTS